MSWPWLGAVACWLAAYEAAVRRRGAAGEAGNGARRWSWYTAGALLAVTGEPPLSGLAHQALWAETAQFGILAFGVVPLAAFGWPRSSRAPWDAWRRLVGLDSRARVLGGLAALACYLVVTIGWRVPPAVDAAVSGRGWLALEAVTLLGGSWALWSVLMGRALPLPRTGRVALGTAATWSVWIFAYVLGFSAHPFYPAFAAGGAPVAAQEVAVGVLLGTSAVAFCPLLFVNLVRWLSADQAAAEAEMSRYAGPFQTIGEHASD